MASPSPILFTVIDDNILLLWMLNFLFLAMNTYGRAVVVPVALLVLKCFVNIISMLIRCL